MPITNEEAADMIAVYHGCFQNATIAEREYAMRYPDCHHYGRRVFTRLAQRLRDTGSFCRPTFRRCCKRRTEENIINVLASIQHNSHIGTRALSADLGIAWTTVRNILKDNRLHAYHIFLHHSLNDEDFDHRLNHCHWMLGMIREDRNLLTKILWTDESTFRSDGWRWIERGSLSPWPAKSPDLTCLDLYLWGRIKDFVYQTQPTTKVDMQNRIRNANQQLSAAEIEVAVLSTKRRSEKYVTEDNSNT
ncbi:uncharacterized protein LOC123675472 [Harmonia axyridis]|uniref:uncharacterized protein LOC123675472 n=1 Tax=Harmonia axyridis TaxID=115357 RepID=UPI001E279439|nr:uncharacterized protein LOC123675472 [Harmonia axyridis]